MPHGTGQGGMRHAFARRPAHVALRRHVGAIIRHLGPGQRIGHIVGEVRHPLLPSQGVLVFKPNGARAGKLTRGGGGGGKKKR
jgi:hypothetical protein